jgi:choline dehydrogenase-like flavoprotein
MRREPGDFESDVLGRPHGFDRVHIVDATTFPTIPATTITFSVMANAYRIAAGVAQE